MTGAGHITVRSPEGAGDKWVAGTITILAQAKNAVDTSLHGKNLLARSAAVDGPPPKNDALVASSLLDVAVWNGAPTQSNTHVPVTDGAHGMATVTGGGHIPARSPEGSGDKCSAGNLCSFAQAKYDFNTSFHEKKVFPRSAAVDGPPLKNDALVASSLLDVAVWNDAPTQSRTLAEVEANALIVARSHANDLLGNNRAQRSPEAKEKLPCDVELLPTPPMLTTSPTESLTTLAGPPGMQLLGKLPLAATDEWKTCRETRRQPATLQHFRRPPSLQALRLKNSRRP